MIKIFVLAVTLCFSMLSLAQQEIKLLSSYNLDPVRFAKVQVGETVLNSNNYGIVQGDFSKVKTIVITHPDFTTIKFPTSQLKVSVTEILLKPIQTYDDVLIQPLPWEQGESEYPGSISVLDPKLIELSNPQTTADLLTVGDKVYVQKSQLGGGSPMIRGLSTNRVLLSVDGVRMNTAIFRGGNLQNAILIDPQTLAKSEIVFGPGTVNYGSDALGGVMDFHTLLAKADTINKNEWKANAKVRFSTANLEKTGHIDLQYLGKRFVSITSVSASNFGDLRMGTREHDDYVRSSFVKRVDGKDSVFVNTHPNIQVGTGYSQLNLMQKFGWKGKGSWNYTFNTMYSTSTDIPRYDRLIQKYGGTLKYAEWKYGPQIWLMNHFSARGKINSVFANEMKISLANQWFEESRIDRKLNNNSKRTRTENVNASSLNIDFNKKFSDETKLFYGVEALYNKVFSAGNKTDILSGKTETIASRYPNNSDWMSFAAYASLQHWVNKYWHIASGLRYNQVLLNANFDNTFYDFSFNNAQQNNGALTGSLGANYQFNGYKYGLNLSTGFRAPNIDDIGKVFDSEPGEVIVPNVNLKPEYIYSADANFEKQWKNQLKIDASVYYSFLNSMIVRDAFTFNGQDSILYDGTLSQVNALQNVDYAQIYGVTASITIPIVDRFYWRNTINVTQGNTQDGSPLRHVSPTFGASHVIYQFNKIYADAYVNFNAGITNQNLAESEKDKAYIYATNQNGNPYSPSWYTVNFKLSYKATQRATFNFGVENILDVRYRPYSSGIVAPGRNFVTSLKFSL